MTEHEIRFEAALKEALQQTLMAEYTPAPGEVLPKPSRRMRRMMRPLLRDPFGRKRRARRRVGRVAAGIAAAFVVVFSMTLAFRGSSRQAPAVHRGGEGVLYFDPVHSVRGNPG